MVLVTAVEDKTGVERNRTQLPRERDEWSLLGALMEVIGVGVLWFPLSQLATLFDH